MNHPAAEIVAIALRKIIKAANSRKYSKLQDDCKEFLDNIQQIIPPLSETGRSGASPPSSLQSNPGLREALREAAAEPEVPEASEGGSEGVETDGKLANQVSRLSSQSITVTQPPNSAGETAVGATGHEEPAERSLHSAASVKAHFEEDIAEAQSSFTAGGAAVLEDHHTASAGTPPATPSHGSEAHASIAHASPEAKAEALAAATAVHMLPDLVPRTETALSDAVCLRIVEIMRLAVDTERPNVIEIALDCLQKLIAFRFLQGAAYAINVEKQGAMGDAGDEKSLHDPAMSTPQAQAVELMCRCDEIPDEGVELQVLKGLLSAATSSTFTIHGQALLLAIRTCYNIYLMSRSEVNQTTAKASLTQMLNITFQRMEADSLLVEVKPIMVTDVLGLPKPGPQDSVNSLTASVQTFLNNVVMVSAHGQGQTPEEIRSSVAASFDNKAHHVSNVVEDKPAAPPAPAEKPTPGHHRAASVGAVNTPHAAHHRTASTSTSTSNVLRTTTDEARSTLLQKDAFLVFRALCKLSIRTSDTTTAQDPTALRGKLLALELLKILLENSGPIFRRSDKFIGAIRQYLCLSLLKNSASSVLQVLQLTASIFLSLISKFRSSLKAEVGVFFPMLILKPFEPQSLQAGAAPAQAAPSSVALIAQRTFTMHMIGELVRDGQLLVDLFVNYDCDLESSNLFERLINILVKVAQQQPQAQPPSPLIVDTSNTYQQEQAMRGEALQTLVVAVEAMLLWYKATAGIVEEGVAASSTAADDAPSAAAAHSDPAAGTGELPSTGSFPNLAAAAAAAAAAGVAAGDEASAAGAGGEELGAKRAYKIKFQEGVALFNRKPKKGIEFLQKESMVGRSAEEIAVFLAKTQGLDKSLIGDYLGEREETCLKVMHAYVDAMEFTNMEFDEAIRAFLSGFRLPGEAQKIDRLMEKFAERYVKCNPQSFKSADVAYVLAYSVIMLNTDAHNPQVKKKMSKDGFLKNNRGINDGQDLPEEFMGALYDRIINNEIKMKDDLLGAGAQAGKDGANQARNIFNTILSLMGATKQQVSNEPSEEAIKHTLDFLHEKAKSSTAVTVTEADAVRPMMEVIWAPLLGALSVLFDEYVDARLIKLTLAGFAASCCLTALTGMTNLRDIFINSICNFTHLHSPATMKQKNALAFKYLLKVAEAVGDHVQDRWVDVLRCISRWELLQQIASGMPTDAVLFSPPERGGIKNIVEKAKRLIKDSDTTDVRSMDSLAMNEMSIKKVHIGGTASAFGRKEDSTSIQPEVVNSCDSHELNMVFLRSGKLDSEAIVAFVKALCSISLDELRDAKAPRVFSLTKIVEIAHYNMTRIRLVWGRIWAVLSEYFITVGCHSNLSVAMYAVDSLRQLAMKFLERDELANYTFQNDFLRPFVVVMRQSQAVEIRELIIRCLSQMVLARVNNVKSGWKSMFMVFTTAAGDKEPMIVRLAFDTIEKIVREHFNHITETETTTFTDCVNCLIAFTNNPHSLDVALNSIAFLRFCAMKLAEGAIGDVDELPEGLPSVPVVHPLRVVAIDNLTPSSSFMGPLPSPHAPKVEQGPPASPLADAPRDSSSGAASPSGRPAPGAGEANGVISPSGSARKAVLKFVDKDEHVYFWFPLLAGLSELTFDPRPEIRNSALEVLFDTLKYHGGTFADSFWKRIFDSVLLPIFDHVRAEVTDTTTFTSEKKRQQEDAWLYETCTKCLRHLVDVFVLFYSETRCLLPNLMELLKSFMGRSHQSLASVGVAAFERLCNTAGHVMDTAAWLEVMDFLSTVTAETAPNALDLVTPPSRQPSVLPQNGVVGPPAAAGASPEITPAALAPPQAGAPAPVQGGPGGGAPAPRTFTLREGVGARRLAKFRSHASVQLLLVQSCSEVYAKLQGVIPPIAVTHLLSALETMATHARGIDMDLSLRRRLAFQQAEDRVPEDRVIADPPLLRLETEAAHAYLSVLLHILTVLTAQAVGKEIAHACQATSRLVQLALSVLQRYVLGVVGPVSPEEMANTQAMVINRSPTLHRSPTMASGSTSSGGGRAPTASPGNGLASLWGVGRRNTEAPRTYDTSRSVAVGRSSHGFPVLMATPAVEYASFSGLVSTALKALTYAMDDPTFKATLPELFPLLTRLIQAEYAPPEVHKALSDLFTLRVGPLVGAPATLPAGEVGQAESVAELSSLLKTPSMKR